MCCMLLCPFVVRATDYYVNPACSTGCDGTSWTKGWASFSDVNWTTLAGAENTLYIAGGTYTDALTIVHKTTNRLYIKPGSASSSPTGYDSEVIIDRTAQTDSSCISMGGGDYAQYVNIDGETTSGAGTRNLRLEIGNNHGIAFSGTGANYINNTVRYVDFNNMADDVNDGVNESRKCIVAPTVNGTLIEYNYFYNNAGSANIQASRGTAGTYGDVTIRYNTFDRVPCDVLQGGSGVDFYGNYVDGTGSLRKYDLIHCYSGATGSGCVYKRIHGNTFKNTDQMIFLEDHSTAGSISNILIYNNVFTTGTSGYGKPILIESNKDVANDTILIANNSFINTAYGIRFYIDATGKTATYTNLTVEDNLFSNMGTGISLTMDGTGTGAHTWANEGDSIFDYNFMDTASLAWDWLEAAGGAKKRYTAMAAYEADHATYNHNKTAASALLDSSYYPLYTSPAINAGADLSATFTTDKDGIPWAGRWGIGAYKFNKAVISIAP